MVALLGLLLIAKNVLKVEHIWVPSCERALRADGGFTRVGELNPGKEEGEKVHSRTLCISEHWIRHGVRDGKGRERRV